MPMHSTELDQIIPDKKCLGNLNDIREHCNELSRCCVHSTGCI